MVGLANTKFMLWPGRPGSVEHMNVANEKGLVQNFAVLRDLPMSTHIVFG